MGDKTSTQIEFKNKYRARAYANMLMMNLYCFAFLVFLSHFNFRFIHDYKKDHMAVSIIGFIALVILMLIALYKFKDACEKNKSKKEQYLWVLLFLTFASVISAFSGSSPPKVSINFVCFLLYAGIFGVSALCGYNSKEDVSQKYGYYPFNIAIGIIALNLVMNFFPFESNSVDKVTLLLSLLSSIAIFICMVFSLQAVDKKLNEIDCSKATDKTKENVAENFSLYASLCVFSSITNLFMFIGQKDGKEANTSVEFFDVESAISNIQQQEPGI